MLAPACGSGGDNGGSDADGVNDTGGTTGDTEDSDGADSGTGPGGTGSETSGGGGTGEGESSTGTGGEDVDPPLQELIAVERDSLTDEELTLFASLQGILSNTSAVQPFLVERENPESSYAFFLDDIRDNHGVPYTDEVDVWNLVERFAPDLDGYILYEAGDSSINVASSLAGVLNALAVDVTLEGQAQAAGLEMVLDVRGRDEDWCGANYWDQLNHGLIVEAKEEIAYELRDFAAKHRAMVFFDGTQNSGWRTGLMGAMDPDATILGWGQVEGSEDGFIINSGRAGVHYLPADWASNLSVLSEFSGRDQYVQQTHDEPEFEENVHYVTFIVSDGDNLQWTINRGENDRWWGSPHRGEFDVGWTFPPHLMTYAPTIMDWHYDTASTGTGRDNFVAGPSGGGFFFAGDYPVEEHELHMVELNEMMGRADLNSVVLLGYNHWTDDAMFTRYLEQPNIDGLFYFEWYSFGLSTHGRTIKWYEGKPVFSGSVKLFERIEEATTVINGGGTDVRSDEGYSVVYANAWEPNIMDNIATVIEGLDPHVRVVTPEEMIKIATNFVEPS